MVSRIIDEHVKPGRLSRDDFAEIGAMILRAGHDTIIDIIVHPMTPPDQHIGLVEHAVRQAMFGLLEDGGADVE